MKRIKRLRRTVKKYQARIPGELRQPLMSYLTRAQRKAIRAAAAESGESISFVLAAIVAAYFPPE